MASPLIEAVELRSRSQPHDPWLFSPQGLDWSFLTWGQAAARLEEQCRGLVAAAGVRVAFPWRCRGEDWLFDMALREAGALAVPLQEDTAAGLVGAAVARRAVILTEPSAPGLASRHPQRPPRGGWLVDGRNGLECWDDARLGRAIEPLEAGLGATAGRDIALLHGSLEQASVRTFLSWATLGGAALIFEPSRQRLLATFFWARPTVLLASASTLDELHRRIVAKGQRWLGSWRFRRLVGRLRGVVLVNVETVDAETREFWTAAGVGVVGAA